MLTGVMIIGELAARFGLQASALLRAPRPACVEQPRRRATLLRRPRSASPCVHSLGTSGWPVTGRDARHGSARSGEPRRLVVLGVNQKGGRGRAKAFSDSLVLQHFVLALDKNADVTNAYKLPSGLPPTFLIDKDGIVRVVKHGGMRYPEMKQLLPETRRAAGN